jgi:hypothetical protein
MIGDFLMDLFRRPKAPQEVVVAVSQTATYSYPWFAQISHDDLEQGDIFEECPTFLPPDNITESNQKPVIQWAERDLILLSQSCDLVKDREKITQACLCEVWRASEFKGSHFLAKPSGLEMVRKGQVPRYHLLARCEIPGFEREFRIIDLQQVYSLPIDFLRSRARGGRLRLLPPYREHLSQAFARVFMRVGLPVDIPPFKTPKT